MGPKIVSLARRSPTARRTATLLAGLAVIVTGFTAASLADPPVVPPERETVRRHLLDVSVVDPGRTGWGSVPGIPREAFEILIDGNPLSPERARLMEFDEMCGPDEARSHSLGGTPRTNTLIVLADLNYLDVGMRHAVARAIEDLADMIEGSRARVKVLAYHRRIVPLTPGSEFTSDPVEIRAAARRLVGTLSPGPPLGDDRGEEQDDSYVGPGDVRDPKVVTLRDATQSGNSPAFQLLLPGSATPELDRERAILRTSPDARLLEQAVDPRPSLAALEAVLIGHGAIPGRKAVILFSSPRFELPDALWLKYMQGPLHAAQNGFVIWAVNARGLGPGRSTDSRSSLLGHLSAATGGGTVRGVGRLSIAFEKAIDQLSCYYLFSIPVDEPSGETERHTITVDLDTGRYPRYWSLRVRAPTSFLLLDDGTRAERRRLAALMEPEGYSFPGVRVDVSYPDRQGERLVAPIELSIRLGDLLFTKPEGEDGAVPTGARFGWEGLVTNASGDTVCQLGDGRARWVHVPQGSPVMFPSGWLVLQTDCALPGPGEYEVRAVVEDLEGDSVGAGRAEFTVFEPSKSTAALSALRLGRNSGQDFLLGTLDGPAADVPRDRAQRAFVPLARDEALAPGDQLMIRFVACHARQAPHVVLYARNESGAPRSQMQLLVTGRGELPANDTICQEYEASLPPGALEPGRYGMALFAPGVDAETRTDVDRLLEQREAEVMVEFTVAQPVRAPPPPPPAADPA